MKKRLLTGSALLFLSVLAASAQMLVGSYNIRYKNAQDSLRGDLWTKRCQVICDQVNFMSPDIFGAQEVLYPQLQDMLRGLDGYDYIGVGRDDGERAGEYAAIFYKKNRVRLLSQGNFWLSETPERPGLGWDAACRRTATWTLLKDLSCDKEFYFVNTHLDHVGQEARRKGLALIVDRIGQMNPKGFPMILTGDFNVYPDDPCLTELRTMMTDAWETAPEIDEGPTWHGWGTVSGTRHIDYIFYSGFQKCTSLVRLTKSYDNVPFVSDHYPVIAVLE